MLRFAIACSALLSFFNYSSAQNFSEIWPQYYLQYGLSKKWSLQSDYSHRYADFFDRKTQWIARAGLVCKLHSGFSAAAGYAYSEYFPATGVRKENRPWQQLQHEYAGKVKVMQRLRLEERFQHDASSNRFNYRIRYQVQLMLPLLPRQGVFLQVSDEPMLNFGKEISGNKFDQNRLQGGLQIKLHDHVFFAPSYLNIYQYQPSRRNFRTIDVVRAGLIYRKI
jgi:hypothetical protein